MNYSHTKQVKIISIGFTCSMVTLALLVGWLLPTPGQNIPLAHAAPACTGGDVTGTIFRDYDNNGTFDSLEPGVISVTVTAYDANGNIIDQCDSSITGTYGLTIGSNYPVRVEVTDYPAYLEPGPAGPDNQTTVTFLEANASDINFSLNNPGDYCQSNPFLVTNCYVVGDQITGPNATSDVLVTLPFTAGATSGGNTKTEWDDPFPEHAGTGEQVGTTWGIAWQRTSNTLFTSAFMKNYSGFGPGGPNAIYQVGIDPTTGLTTTNPSLLVDVSTLAGVTGCSDPHGIDLTSNRGYLQPAFDAVGKCGLGDLEISDDDSTLYTVNLTDRKVLAIDPSTGSLINSWDFPTNQGDCSDPDDIRPFGLGYNDGTLYIGAVCSAESVGPTAGNVNCDHIPGVVTCDINAGVDDLRGYVYTLNETTGVFTPVLNFPFTDTNGPRNPACTGFGTNNCHYWRAWITNYTPYDRARRNGNGQGTAQQNWRYPTPLISDIEFYNGDLTIGVRDRSADQWGADTPYPVPILTPPDLTLLRQGGDLLCATPNGSGGWDLESGLSGDGVCGSRTPPAPRSVTASQPNGREFYWGDTGDNGHSEISSGGLVQLGANNLALSALNPSEPYLSGGNVSNSGGINWINNENGQFEQGYILYQNFGASSTFGKANGIGDVEAFCTAAPIELGNRIWLDLSGDGEQDPGEPGISGVIVGLYTITGTLVATQTTDINGNYVFTASIGIQTNTTYTIGILDSNFNSGGALFGSLPGPADQNPNGLPNPDLRDSDGVTVTVGAGSNVSSLGVTFSTGGPGSNDHTIDFGLIQVDWGDAPDPTYPILDSSNGARHIITPTSPFMGAIVDAEADGQPNITATGDDDDGSDDEDGVIFTDPLIPGIGLIPISIDMTGSANGCLLNAWIDFNIDGDWDDSSDQIFTDTPLTAGGVNVLAFTVPATATVNTITYARFRCSDEAGLAPTGLALNGEVEDYLVILGELDWGDAPDTPDNTYPTYAISGGAHHDISLPANPFMGAGVDAEPDGQPTVGADGDDSNTDDEDGITFPVIPLIPGGVDTIFVDMTASPTPCLLNAWIDFNGDGDWDDTLEQIATDAPMPIGGVNPIPVTTPITATQGLSYARFRCDIGGGLPPAGFAPDGEVEDYVVNIGFLDWGDAPDPQYPTLVGSAGAAHVISATSPFMGTCVDNELDGQPDIPATGDDTAAGTTSFGPELYWR